MRKNTLRRKTWHAMQWGIRQLFRPLGLRVAVDISSGIGYYLLDTPLRELLTKSARPKASVAAEIPPADAILQEYVTPRSEVLEIGVGTGRMMRWLAPRVARFEGIDVSFYTLWLARRTTDLPRTVRLRRGSGVRLPMPDASFDLVYSRAVIVHLSKEDAFCVLRESMRVVRPGGIVSHDFPLLKSYLPEFVDLATSGDRTYTRARHYTEEEIALVHDAAGLEVLKILLKAPGELVVIARRVK